MSVMPSKGFVSSGAPPGIALAVKVRTFFTETLEPRVIYSRLLPALSKKAMPSLIRVPVKARQFTIAEASE